MGGVASRTQLTEPVERLLARERAEVLAGLQRRHRRALDDNPEGMAIISKALGQALLLGLREQCRLEDVYTHRLQAGPDAWARWQEVRDQTPESLDWPDQLSQRAHDAVEQARGLVESAAAELDIRSRERRDFRGTGEQPPQAGAAPVRTHTRPAG